MCHVLWRHTGGLGSRSHWHRVRRCLVERRSAPLYMAFVAISLCAHARPYGSDLLSLPTTLYIGASLKKLLR